MGKKKLPAASPIIEIIALCPRNYMGKTRGKSNSYE